SSDLWRILHELELLLDSKHHGSSPELTAFDQSERALQMTAAISGLVQENMNRVAGWRFLEMARRIERGINSCQYVERLAGEDAQPSYNDMLLDLTDCQITSRQ